MTDNTDTLTNALSPILEAGPRPGRRRAARGAATVFVDRAGIGLDELGEATRDVSTALDDIDPMPGRYTLSARARARAAAPHPGPLRPGGGGDRHGRVDVGTAEVRRVTGTLDTADESGCTLFGPEVPGGAMRIAYDRIERARTVFEWGPEPRRAKSERVKRQ